MNLQSTVLVSAVLLLLLAWLLAIFVRKRISSGQALFWLFPLAVAEVFALWPPLIDRVSSLWGSLVPVSWITFSGMVLLIFYLLYLTTKVNRYARLVELARSVAYLEQRLRQAEERCRALEDGRPRPS